MTRLSTEQGNVEQGKASRLRQRLRKWRSEAEATQEKNWREMDVRAGIVRDWHGKKRRSLA